MNQEKLGAQNLAGLLALMKSVEQKPLAIICVLTLIF